MRLKKKKKHDNSLCNCRALHDHASFSNLEQISEQKDQKGNNEFIYREGHIHKHNCRRIKRSVTFATFSKFISICLN